MLLVPVLLAARAGSVAAGLGPQATIQLPVTVSQLQPTLAAGAEAQPGITAVSAVLVAAELSSCASTARRERTFQRALPPACHAQRRPALLVK